MLTLNFKIKIRIKVGILVTADYTSIHKGMEFKSYKICMMLERMQPNMIAFDRIENSTQKDYIIT